MTIQKLSRIRIARSPRARSKYVMSNAIRHSGKRLVSMVLLASGVVIYIGLVTAQVLAEQLSQAQRASRLRWAVELDPLNAEYRDEMARFQLLVEQSATNALPWAQSATKLNPHRAAYWFDRAVAENLTENAKAERHSLARMTEADSHSAGFAWEAGNLYLTQGDIQQSLSEYRRVLQNDPQLTPAAIEVCWRIRPDIDELLENVVPASADEAFLNFLISTHNSPAAEKVWERIASSQQPITRSFLFDYLRYLFSAAEATQAAHVWQEAAYLPGLAAYEPTEENLLVNGDFGLEILNGGFDWAYQETSAVTLALDPNEAHSGRRSLRISFEGPGIADAGIRQIVAVEPDTRYEFSGYYKAQEMDGAGGAEFTIQDLYKETTFFVSDDLRNTNFWTQVTGAFTTGPDTHLLVLQIARVPAGSPIRGTVWIDDLKLVTADHLAAINKEQQ